MLGGLTKLEMAEGASFFKRFCLTRVTETKKLASDISDKLFLRHRAI